MNYSFMPPKCYENQRIICLRAYYIARKTIPRPKLPRQYLMITYTNKQADTYTVKRPYSHKLRKVY